MKILIISDAKTTKSGNINAIFNSIAYEMEHLVDCFSKCEIIGIESAEASDMVRLNDPKYLITSLRNEGFGINGFSFIYLLDLFFRTLLKVPKYDVIHVRGPGVPMFYGIIFSIFFPQKRWWFKYANDWSSWGKSSFWDLQKKMLGYFFWTKVTVNGEWDNLPKHIFSFENPCILEKNKFKINQRNNRKVLNIAYVGRLSKEKGILVAYKAFLEFKTRNKYINTKFFVIGEGNERTTLEKLDTQGEIIFKGVQNKDSILNILSECDLIVLPTVSPEGFPKVIAEAMSVGCIPIVTNISCINQYIRNEHNGFLIDCDNLNFKFQITKYIEYYFLAEYNHLELMRHAAQFTSFEYFTYERFTERVKNLILN